MLPYQTRLNPLITGKVFKRLHDFRTAYRSSLNPLITGEVFKLIAISK